MKHDIEALAAQWAGRTDRWFEQGPAVFVELAEKILACGEPLLAFDVANVALEHAGWECHVRLRQLEGLALARSGAVESAHRLFTELLGEGHADAETMGMLARTCKDLGVRSSGARRRKYWSEALRIYETAYRAAAKPEDAQYTGINAATMAMLLGHRERSRRLAGEVQKIGGDSYWSQATLGEAALLKGDLAASETHYARAAELGRGRFGDLSSTRRQARLLLQTLGLDPRRLDRLIAIPSVVTFAGHMIDAPGRRRPRFPASEEAAVARHIADRLERVNAGFGFASAASGADILFLEAMLSRGGEIHIVLPFPAPDFIRVSVGSWVERFERVMARAAGVHFCSDHRPPQDDLVLEYTQRIQNGLARLRAATLDTPLVPLAVWDGCAGDGGGGTASMIEAWRARRWTPEIISVGDGVRRAMRPRSRRKRRDPQKITALLFGDVVRYSTLTEEQIPIFVRDFLGTVGKLLDRTRDRPVYRNTWGDGLYLVFDRVDAAGRFALDLRDRIEAVDWARKGLPRELTFRLALHAGPTYVVWDPITRKRNFTGAHVSRAARIEPITAPGQVYASRQFAALAAAEEIPDFVCEYVGQVPFAKKFGTYPVYHVRRASASPAGGAKAAL